ncbi:hypothetical protein [Dehalobacter sp.]|uniref:hypothetical protein n=1 Tax=Dehalobacter sp. TaxID=1962289 RepID=UPI00258BB38E|nr:hypothetical protein [Dehalobacter sp.]MDJ0306727.1 hypothetical protein [Dehalobacter sp.]
MKQAVQKKPKTFRTLIRQTNCGNRELQDKDGNVNIVDNGVKQVDNPGKERRKQPLSFFGQ